MELVNILDVDLQKDGGEREGKLAVARYFD